MQQLSHKKSGCAVPFIIMSPFDAASPRQFETANILRFRYPELPALEILLAISTHIIPGKCFVSLPRRQAAELARQQASPRCGACQENKYRGTNATSRIFAAEIKTQEERFNVNGRFPRPDDRRNGCRSRRSHQCRIAQTIQQSQPNLLVLVKVQANLANVAIPEVEEDDEEVEMSDAKSDLRRGNQIVEA